MAYPLCSPCDSHIPIIVIDSLVEHLIQNANVNTIQHAKFIGNYCEMVKMYLF